MDERTHKRQQPKQVAPERVARMFERLREGIPDYEFDQDNVPFHSSYDNWHFLGKRRAVKRPQSSSSGSTLKTPTSATHDSLPQSVRSHSDYEPHDESVNGAGSTESGEKKEQFVIARVSKHALRLEREYKQAVSLRKLSEADNVHFIKPLAFYRLPAKQAVDKPLAVSIVEAPGKNYLLDIVEFGPNFYRANNENLPQATVKEKQMPLLTFLDFAIGASECCEILHHGHEMVHGELRGDAFHYNRDTGTVRLINFGAGARSFEHGLTSAGWSSLTAERGVEHKLQFIAPEQTGRLPAEPDSRTDIYSLGILFWTMLTGVSAFAGKTPLEIMQNVLSRRLPSATGVRSDVPDALSAILQKMTHKAMDERYNSASGVKHDLQVLKKILTDGDTDALNSFKVAQNDISCFFKLPTHLVGRQQQRDTIIAIIERAAKRFEKGQNQPLAAFKKGLISLSSGTSMYTASDRLGEGGLDELISESTSSGGSHRGSRLNSMAEVTSVSSNRFANMGSVSGSGSQDSVATGREGGRPSG